MNRMTNFMAIVLGISLTWASVGRAAADESTAARADDPGQEQLDAAIDLRVNASTLAELDEIIRLCDEAIEKGLDPENTVFAGQIASGALLQRATLLARIFHEMDLSDPAAGKRALQMRRQALSDADRALKHDSEQTQAHLVIARLEALPGGDHERAGKSIDEVIRLTQDDPATRSEALLLRARLATDDAARQADLDEAVKLQPDSPQPLRARGLHFIEAGDRARGLDDLKMAVELEPKDASTHELLGAMLADAGQLDEALAAVNEAMELGSRGYGAFFLRARLQIARKDYESALQDLDKVLELRPGFSTALRVRAALMVETGRETEAIADFEAARDRSPDDTDLILQLGMLYNSTGYLGKALECFGEAANKRSDDFLPRMLHGDVLLGLGRHSDALADYVEAHKLETGDSGLLNNYAWLLATSPDDAVRNGARSIELATEACRLTEYKAPHILSTLAAGYAESGDFAKAIEWSTKAVEMGDGELKEALQKELESYQAGKPWREKLDKPLVPPVPAAEVETAESNDESEVDPTVDPTTEGSEDPEATVRPGYQGSA